MRILITGAGGQLGTDLVRAASSERRHEVVGAERTKLDVGDRDAVLAGVTGLAPDLIVHAAAWTAVDACEADPERAWRDNALACRNIAEAARLTGAHLVAVSTDYVFDGTAAGPYVEWDRPNPSSLYGRSKLAGEEEIRSLLPDATVARTSWVCGAHGSNMVKTVLRLAGQAGPMRFVDDQRGCPTFTEDLAGMLLRLGVGRRPGLFHVTNQGPTTWYHFARDVLAAAGLDPERVEPITTAELDPPRPAPRPANSVLDNAALRMSGIDLLADYHEPLERAVKALT
ncbi:MAG: dTDP-4-dehydrorhamnose reductase, partial [Acidimicrobiales bacterium]|nr:dTDP-4-dehydrorhamnose reductase [Acidimicrobiales bacterium]